MGKLKVPLLLLPSFLVAACVSAVQAEATPTLEEGAISAPATTQVGETAGDVAEPLCTVVSQAVTQEADSAFPPVTGEDWSLGPEDAKVTIIEYGDFQ